jgi:hypothetical protein
MSSHHALLVSPTVSGGEIGIHGTSCYGPLRERFKAALESHAHTSEVHICFGYSDLEPDFNKHEKFILDFIKDFFDIKVTIGDNSRWYKYMKSTPWFTHDNSFYTGAYIIQLGQFKDQETASNTSALLKLYTVLQFIRLLVNNGAPYKRDLKVFYELVTEYNVIPHVAMQILKYHSKHAFAEATAMSPYSNTFQLDGFRSIAMEKSDFRSGKKVEFAFHLTNRLAFGLNVGAIDNIDQYLVQPGRLLDFVSQKLGKSSIITYIALTKLMDIAAKRDYEKLVKILNRDPSEHPAFIAEISKKITELNKDCILSQAELQLL